MIKPTVKFTLTQNVGSDNSTINNSSFIEPLDNVTDVACFCCSLEEESWNMCHATTSDLKELLEKYKDETVLLEDGLIEHKTEEAFSTAQLRTLIRF